MNQSGKQIHNANLQEFLDSAANANEKGQQQFFTPHNLAAALCQPLPARRKDLVFDLAFGSGNLAAAAGARHAIGLDIDARVTKDLTPPEDALWEVEKADLTHWYPIAAEVGFTAPYILINPPFSLRWYADRLTPLRSSDIPEIAEAAATFGEYVDSTLASFLIALDLLAYNGDGFMVCNSDTAKRFLGTDGKHPALRKYIWAWLEIPGAIYEGQHTAFDTAVLYFSRSHGNHGAEPLHLTAPSADALAVERTLMCPEIFSARKGSRIVHSHECRVIDTLASFKNIATEYGVRHRGRRPAWNIRLDDSGNLRTHLTPFQNTSKKLCRTLIGKLHALTGHAPISLCVTATARTALREAMQCGVWTIEPAVLEAVAKALADYDREGAPFYPPNEVQALGWIDEHGQLACKAPGIGSCQPGERYTIASTVETTNWEGKKTNLLGEEERLSYSGRELLVTLTDPDGVKHHFHVRKDEKIHEDETKPCGTVTARHWHIADLVRHFAIPIPQDIATLRPTEYQANLASIKRLEEIINQRIALAS